LATWDVFHGDQLEVERALTLEAVRQALARGSLRDDDLIRPAGTTAAWVRLADFPGLLTPEPQPEPESPPDRGLGFPPGVGEASPVPPPLPASPSETEPEFPPDDDDPDSDVLDFPQFEVDDTEVQSPDEAVELSSPRAGHRDPSPPEPEPFGDDDGFEVPDDDDSLVALPIDDEATRYETDEDEFDDKDYDPQDEDEAIAEFTLARGSSEKVEELDLAAMVDVAFQLVLFFLVTATTVLYKSLEVPKPNPESPAAAAAQGHSRSLDDLKEDYILVEIDPVGAMKIDREPVSADMAGLVERLRDARERTGRKAMLLSADFATPHRNAVLAYDAANEIGLGIAIARPSGNGSEPAANPPAPKKAARG